MIQWLLGQWGKVRAIAALAIGCLVVIGSLLVASPAWATSSPADALTPQDQVERAYELGGESTGLKEEIYQQRLQEGQDPESMPRPYKRMRSFDKQQEVPQTSLLEKAASQLRQVIDQPDQ